MGSTPPSHQSPPIVHSLPPGSVTPYLPQPTLPTLYHSSHYLPPLYPVTPVYPIQYRPQLPPHTHHHNPYHQTYPPQNLRHDPHAKEVIHYNYKLANTNTHESTLVSKPTNIQPEDEQTKRIAIGGKESIGKALEELQETSLLSLQNSDKKINLIGPIKVRATGPKTFSIVDNIDIDPIEIEMETDLTEKKDKKREQNKSLAKHLATFYSTTKRPSLHFEELEEPSLKFKNTPKKLEKITFRHSTTSIPALSPSSMEDFVKSDLSKYQNSNHIRTNTENSNPYKTKVLPKSIKFGNILKQREPKKQSSFRFEDESNSSLKVRFVEIDSSEAQTNTRNKNVIFPEK